MSLNHGSILLHVDLRKETAHLEYLLYDMTGLDSY